MNNKTIKNAVIYTRVSSVEQAECGFSLARQEEECKEFALKQGCSVSKIFVEKGESAKTVDRTELKNMLEYCAQNKKNIDYIIVWKLDRLSRNMNDHYALSAFLGKLDIDILSATENNQNDAVGKLTRNMLQAFSQFENDQKSERVIAGMKQALIEGKWLWRAPLGYKLIDGELLIDEEKAPMVRKIFELYASGLYKHSCINKYIKKHYNYEIPTVSLYSMLKNLVYCGKMYCPSLHKEVVKGKFEAIVSDELFAKVQSMLGGNRFQALTNRINSAEFPLRQFVLCPFCGTPLTASKSTGSKNKKYAYYHCYNSSCKTKVRIPKNTLEKMFIEFLSTVKPNKECIETVKKSLKEQYSSMSKEFNKNHNDLSKKLTELKSTKDKLVDLYIQGKIDDTIYQSKLDSIKKEENEISITLNELKTPKANFNSCLDYVLNSLENLENLWLDNDLETKQKLQKLIFPSGLIYEETGFRTGSNPWFDIKKGALMAPIFYMVPPREFESLSTP